MELMNAKCRKITLEGFRWNHQKTVVGETPERKYNASINEEQRSYIEVKWRGERQYWKGPLWFTLKGNNDIL